MATYDLGAFIMQLKGTYSASTTYNRLDVVTYNGSSYVCKTDSTKGKIPTNTTYWQQIAAAGTATLTEAQKTEIVNTIVSEKGVVVDPNYIAITSEQLSKLDNLSEPNNGTLTFTSNGNKVATFSANSKADVTVALPTLQKRVFRLDDMGGSIDVLEPNAVYYADRLSQLIIKEYGYPREEYAVYALPQTDIIFTAETDFVVELPSEAYIKEGATLQVKAGRNHITCLGFDWTIEHYEDAKQ